METHVLPDEGLKDPANGLPSIELSELPAVLERIITVEKMTPLILDPLDVGARAFFSYKGRLEVKNLSLMLTFEHCNLCAGDFN